ncbi:putative mediator of RNA polymerase II transcription subunit 26 isoform X2 [Coccinella septempunctata]|nr:putative mediator of RNA polymerase II transcription subunit 26 isoform X2 [Coccinella septempunctata]
MATWYCILSVLIYFQDTTATLVPVSVQYAPKCEGLRCHEQPQYKVLQSQYLLQPQLHQGIQQAEYQHPIVQEKPYPKCPLGHLIGTNQAYEINDQQKLLQSVQHLHALLQYQNQEQKQQEYQASYNQLKKAEQQKYQATYQQSNDAYQQKNYQASFEGLNNAYQQKNYQASFEGLNNAYQQKNYQASYEGLNNAYQQKDYQVLYQGLNKGFQQKGIEASYQNVNNGYLPPQIPQQLISNDIYKTAYQSSQKESQNSLSQSQIHQEILSNTNIQKGYESLRQKFNNAQLSSQIQQQQLLNANIQQNEHVKSELSQEHHGKIKQTINYDISHQHQGLNQHQSHLNVYNDAKSSTNIERHLDTHHHEDGNDGNSEEIDYETGKKKKDHDAYYKFEYGVNDQHTGDIKNHKEERAGDEVRGEYSLVEKDGNVRTVKYFADWKTGFHATVHNSKSRN